MKEKIKIALVGNPNSGKSSLFNALTGLNQKVGNFPGVTVDKKTGLIYIYGHKIELIDLPGTYSIYPRALDEEVTFEVLCDPNNEAHPDVVVIVADATNLRRNLLFITQVIDLKIPVVLAINMIDVAAKQGILINYARLEEMLGVKVVPISARLKTNLPALKTAMVSSFEKIPEDTINFNQYAPEMLAEIRGLVKTNSDYAAFQLILNLEKYAGISEFKKSLFQKIRDEHEVAFNEIRAKETLDRYSHISGIMRETFQRTQEPKATSITKKIDKWVCHPIYGYIIFLGMLTIVFQAIFSLANYPMELIENVFNFMSNWVKNTFPPGMFTDLVANGIIAGLSGVIIFLPQIVLLFAFLTILEDTGYMARVSFLMDKIMRRFGMNGKSIVPLISGFACAVPSIMATRNISSWKERILTIMVVPLMSCSARLPVYTLLISLVIPTEKIWGFISIQGLILLGFYVLGFIAAIGASFVMSKIIKERNTSVFMLEMPSYHSPRWQNIGLTLVEKSKAFVFEAGKVIIAVSVILWALSSFAPGNRMEEIEAKYAQFESNDTINVAALIQKEQLEASYAGIIGRFIEPSIEPLGFDWKIGIALVTSFAAREVFVGTMATIYSVGNDELDVSRLTDRLKAEVNPKTGEPLYNLATAFSLMIFYAFAMQCMSTMAVTLRETKSWKWTLIQTGYMTGLAYVASWVVYNLLR